MLSNTLRLNFCYLKIIRFFFHSGYYPKIIRDILKNVQKITSVYMFKQYYMINYNENEAENEK